MVGVALLALQAAAALAATGDLTQKSGTAGCVSDTGTGGACAQGHALSTPESVTVSPDGTSAYVASNGSDAVSIFDRNTTTGVLTQKVGSAGCIATPFPLVDCVAGTALSSPRSVAVSPDGANVYVAAFDSDAVAIFDRNTTTGALTQKPGTAGCVSDTGTGGACAQGHALAGPSSVTVSPDGANVYVASNTSSAVAIFVRNKATGGLTQSGCISQSGTGTCVHGSGLQSARALTVSPDGTSVYVASTGSGLAVFTRNTTTGALAEDGCIRGGDTGELACTSSWYALAGARSVTVSPDSASVYVTGENFSSVASFSRNKATRALTQNGCISLDGLSGTCASWSVIATPTSVTVSPDGASAYVTSYDSGAVAVFDRDLASGALTRRPGTAGCISKDGTGGACVQGVALDGPEGAGVSPDGRSVYVTSNFSNAVAVFDRSSPAPSTHVLTVSVMGTGKGAITGPGINCRATCSRSYASGTHVTLIATPNAGSTFAGWMGACTGRGPCHATLSQNRSVMASFARSREAGPPNTKIVSATIRSRKRGATFTFKGTGGRRPLSFQCKLDKGSYKSCRSPQSYAHLSPGKHVFWVRAKDSRGQRDPTPAERKFTIKR